MTLYIIKVKSSTKLPDFVQVRDENFILQGYMRLDRELKDLSRFGLAEKKDAFLTFLKAIPFGEVRKWPTTP